MGLTVVNGEGNADTDNGKCYLSNVMGCINFFLEQKKIQILKYWVFNSRGKKS